MSTELTARAKLTLSLRIIGIRQDGYHLLDAEMITLDLSDRIVLEPKDDGDAAGEGDAADASEKASNIEVFESGNPATDTELSGSENLAAKALALSGKNADIKIYKEIPAAAGLGGGSANAAAVLRWAGFTDLQKAAALGADIPFCMTGGRAQVRGIGEEIEPLPFEAASYTLLTPPVRCPTAAIYQKWDEMGGPKGDSGNDLEPAALAFAKSMNPNLAYWRDCLAEATGSSPRLAGSGSTWFVEGAHADAVDNLNRQSGVFACVAKATPA